MSTLETDCKHHGSLTKAQLRPGFGTRLLRMMKHPDGQLRAVHWPDTFDFITPAMGDGYSFDITVHFTWCVTGDAYAEALVQRAKEHRITLLERLIAQLRGISRRFPPYEAADAEERIDQAVKDLFNATRLTFLSPTGPDGDARPIAHRTVLALDKQVKKAQKEAWSQRQEAMNKHDLERLNSMQLNERRRMWQEFLERGRSEWLTPYAVALAEDPGSVAEVIERMAMDRRAQAKELADHVVGQVRSYQDRDAFDLMLQNDRVLRHLMELMGIPGLPPVAPSPFDER
jgi:hypothetical protein